MCTVLVRFTPGVLRVGAVRDEFVDRAWDPPGAYWGDRLLGGRDRTAGGTWLAVDPYAPAVAAVLNGVRRPPPVDAVRPTRGTLPLGVLRGEPLPDPTHYDGFHLVLGTPDAVHLWSWDGTELVKYELPMGDHVIVNAGIASARAGELAGVETDADWVRLLAGDAVLVDRTFAGRRYGSTSTSLVTLAAHGARYDFNPRPRDPSAWYRVT